MRLGHAVWSWCAVYFLHLPYAREDDHAELAAGVAALIARLIELETTAMRSGA